MLEASTKGRATKRRRLERIVRRHALPILRVAKRGFEQIAGLESKVAIAKILADSLIHLINSDKYGLVAYRNSELQSCQAWAIGLTVRSSRRRFVARPFVLASSTTPCHYAARLNSGVRLQQETSGINER